MAVEARRGCGYRKVGGLYLVGTGLGVACDRLPIPLEICRCCGQGIKQTRGWTWVDIAGLVGGDHWLAIKDDITQTETGAQRCNCPKFCPLCHNVKSMGRGGLLWIGTQFYATVEDFEVEARTLGVSRRIASVPRGFKLGETWLLFAHPKAISKPVEEEGGLLSNTKVKLVPGIFRVWKPERLERIYKESDRNSDAVKADIERGITPVFVPDNDKDHQGSVYDKEEEESAPPLFPPA